jgi:hypothetical protein
VHGGDRGIQEISVSSGDFFCESKTALQNSQFLMIAILTGVRWNLSVVLIYISFMARDVFHVVFGHLNFFF